MDHKLGFIGFGHMAQIICKSILDRRIIPYRNIFFTRRDQEKAVHDAQNFQIHLRNLDEIVSSCDFIIFCTRPQEIEAVFDSVDFSSCNASLFLTVLAGTPLSYFEKKLAAKSHIIRAMPNIPIEKGEGMTALAHNPALPREELDLVVKIFSSIGEVEIMQEKFLDIVTGLCGSSPAMISQLIDAIAQAGIREGLNPQKAHKIVAQAFLGTAKMIKEGADPHQLTDSMRLKGGTTIAGLEVFEESPIKADIEKSVRRVIERAKELSRDTL